MKTEFDFNWFQSAKFQNFLTKEDAICSLVNHNSSVVKPIHESPILRNSDFWQKELHTPKNSTNPLNNV